MKILSRAGLAFLLAAMLCGCAIQAPWSAGGSSDAYGEGNFAGSIARADGGALAPQALLSFAVLTPVATRPAGAHVEPPANEEAARLLTEAAQLQAKGEFASALADLEKARAADSESLAVQRQLAFAYAGLGNWAKARKPLETVAAQAGDDVEIQYTLGRMAAADGKPDLAATYFRSALMCSDANDADVTTNQCLVRLALLLARRGYLTASLECYQRVENNLLEHGRELAKSGELGTLITQPETLLCREGRLLLRLGKSEQAASLGDDAYRLNKSYVPAVQLVIESLVAAKDFSQAEPELMELMYGPAPSLQVRQMMELVYRAKNDPSGPARLWRQYRANTPHPPAKPVLTFAQACWNLGAHDKAIAILRQYTQMAQSESQTAAQLAQWLITRGDVVGAMDVLSSLVDEDASAAEVAEQTVESVPAARISEQLVGQLMAGAQAQPPESKFAPYFTAALLARRGNLLLPAEQSLLASVQDAPDFLPGYRALVGYYIDQRQFDKAMAQATAAQGGMKEEFVGPYLTGWVLLAEGKRDEAIKSLSKSVELEADYAPSRRLLAGAQLAAGHPDLAEHHLLHAFRELQDMQSGEAMVKMYLDLASAARGKDASRQRTAWLLRARQTVEAMIQVDSENPVALRMQTALQHMSGQNLQARQTLSRLLAVAPDDLQVRMLKVLLEAHSSLSAQGPMGPMRYKRACDDLQYVLDRNPDSMEAQLLMARIDMASGRNVQAAACLARLHAAHPNDLGVGVLYAIASSRAGAANQAAGVLEGFASELNKDESLWLLAVVLGDAKRHDGAAELLRARISRAPSPAAALPDKQILVHVLGRAGNLKAALELADQMVDANAPESVDAAGVARMDVLAEAGRFDDMKAAAIKWLDQTDLSRWGQSHESSLLRVPHRWALQMSVLRWGQEAKSWRLLAGATSPLDLAIAYLLRDGRINEAESFAARQIERCSAQGDKAAAVAAATRISLVIRLHMAGYDSRARKDLERFIKVDPENQELLALTESVLDPSDPAQFEMTVQSLAKAISVAPAKSESPEQPGLHPGRCGRPPGPGPIAAFPVAGHRHRHQHAGFHGLAEVQTGTIRIGPGVPAPGLEPRGRRQPGALRPRRRHLLAAGARGGCRRHVGRGGGPGYGHGSGKREVC